MKAKNSLRGLLWPLMKQYNSLKYRLLGTDKAQKKKSNPFMDMQKVAADSRRIAEKLREMELAAGDKVHNTLPASGSAADAGKSGEPDQLRCGWREDENDRWTAPGPLFSSYRQNPYADQHPEKMKAIMRALFLADHDAAQLEQYELENRLHGAVLTKPANYTNRFFSNLARILFTVIFLLGARAVKGQELKALTIGDPVPDITIQNILNYPTSTAKISDFNDKLLILDFWSTTCRGSIELLPQMAGLQQAFPDKLQIIAVGKEEMATISKVASSKNLSGLAFTPADPQLLRLFPHELVPQLVWISPDGSLLGITTEYDATESAIRQILTGEPYAFQDPKADQMNFDPEKPMFLKGNGTDDTYLYRSVLLKYSNGLPGMLGIRKDSSAVRLYAINQGRLPLYFMALQLPGYTWPHNRILYEGVDRAKFTSSNWVEDKWDKTYCYELSLPLFFEDRARAIMLQDLQRLFGVTGRVEKRNTACYVLQALPGKINLRTKGGPASNSFHEPATAELRMKNTSLYELVAHLQEKEGSLPILDETGYKLKADMELQGSLQELEKLNGSLARYGLAIQRTERPIDMLVFKPVDSMPPTRE